MNRAPHPETVPDLLAAAASAAPDRLALIIDDAGADAPRPATTYADWNAKSASFATGLIELEIEAGSRIGLLFERAEWIDHAVAYIGCQRAATVPVLIPFDSAKSDIEKIARELNLRLLVTRRGSGSRGPAETLSVDEVVAAGPTRGRCVESDDLADIISTSGTTGIPSSIASTHRQLLAGVTGTSGPAPSWRGKPLLHAFPPCTSVGTQGALLLQLRAAMTGIVLPIFHPKRFCATVRAFRVAVVYLVPSMATLLVAWPGFAAADLSSIEVLMLTGSRLPAPLFRSLTERLPQALVLSLYGLTEGGGAQLITRYDPRRPTTVGRITGRTEARIVDERGMPLPAGRVGEIWLRRRDVAPRRYATDTAATASAFVDGWTRTGDVGYVDDDGYVYVTDRQKEIIIVGGRNVSASEIERVLEEYPAIAEAAVVSARDQLLGERPAAFVTARARVSHEELLDFARERLASWKVPTQIRVVDELPRNRLGKVDKTSLVAEIATNAPE